MWLLKKSIEISSGHHLKNYKGPCMTPHGHNYKITVYCKTDQLNHQGMVIDFSEIKRIVKEYDHVDLNTLPEFKYVGDELTYKTNTTAENIAYYLFNKIPLCYRIDVEETCGSIITYFDHNQESVNL